VTRPYLNAKQLEELTPWSRKAIDQMVRREVLVRDVHWFQPLGPRTQIVFKWNAIAAFIEGAHARAGRTETANVEEAKAELRRLLDRESKRAPTATVPVATPPAPGRRSR
jgi:hypothetical protein